MKYNFNGMSTDNEPNRELFEEMYNGTLIKSEPFTVELDNKEVKLHIFIEDLDMAEYDDCEDHIITIGVVPDFTDLSKKNQENILDQFMPEDRDNLDNMTLTHEGMLYGYNVPLHSVTVTDLNKVEDTIDSAIAVHSAIESLIGFDLDKMVNRLGSTGWDFLNDFCCDIDFVTTAINRYSLTS